MSPKRQQRSQKASAANNNNKISKYLNNDRKNIQSSSQEAIPNNNEIPAFTVEDTEFKLSSESVVKPSIISPERLQNQLKSFKDNGDAKQMISCLVDAYSSIAKAVECNHTNLSKMSQIVDDNTACFKDMTDQLNDEIAQASVRHNQYVEQNENDKLEMKVKSDIRYFKSQMIIFLKNDGRLKNIGFNDCIVESEKIITEQGLSLERAYITKAILLSGMKRINNVNRLTRYLYVHFSDSFTAERLIVEMIMKNKQSNSSQPNVIFTQPSSYDIRKVKNICHQLQSEGNVSKVFLGDDSVKVTLNKKNPDDINEKATKVHIRNFSDLDKLRKNTSAADHHIPSRTYFNKNWSQNRSTSKKNEKRKADDDESGTNYATTSYNKKQRTIVSNSRRDVNDTTVESLNTSTESVIHNNS